ncbi:MAG TPA: amidohydrolase [Chloroflexota bacterium]|nr:amidohydrolase [Chloroflexota bacterium]
MTETLYENGVIHTVPGVERAGALLIRDGHVAATGDAAGSAAGSTTRRIDLAGRSIVPGFIDSHCHILQFGLTLGRLDVGPGTVRSTADIQRLIAGRATSAPADAWIQGNGYDSDRLAEHRHPTRDDLDAAASHHPVVLWHTSLHALTCNSRALELAGIGPDTPNPPGGEILRDESGRATGVLTENAMELVAAAVPAPTETESREAIVRAMRAMVAEGVTSASDAASGEGPEFEPTIALYRQALADGMPGRVTLMPEIFYVAPPSSDTVVPPGAFETGVDPDRLRIGATKIFADGALTTRTAAVRQPYPETGGYGILRWETPVLNDMIERAHRAGWQIATHALGDRAIEVVLDAYERAIMARPLFDRRHRIEHYMMADAALVDRTVRLGIIPNLQPDLGVLGDAYVAALGIAESSKLIPVRLLREHLANYAFSSDRPVIPGAPLAVIRDAMERRTPGGIELGPENAVSALEAIYDYTAGGAYATHSEKRLGWLLPDRLADLVILSADPATVDIAGIAVLETVIGGDTVWEA